MTENSSLGRAAMFLGEDNTANVNGHVYLIRLKKDEANEFILHILTTKEYRNLIREVCVGGIDKRQLNKDHIEEFPIIYPPLKHQYDFVTKLLLTQNQKKQLEVSAKESKNLFNKLMNLNFS
jgi:type I restriction enzyme S subunit